MYLCEICGKIGDIHHVVHTCEGGLDVKLNYKYLCKSHHRGTNGPHSNAYIDLGYKIDLQNKLYEILNKDYYNKKELMVKLDIGINAYKKLTHDLIMYKNGYNKKSIITRFMGGKIYDSDIDIIEIEIKKLQKIFR